MSEHIPEDQVTFERLWYMTPAYDKRNPVPSKNYGIHGVELRMVLKGPLGATQFLLFTNWQLPHVTEEHMARFGGDPSMAKSLYLPLPADLGYHWNTPRYEDQTKRECEYTASGFCYYDGSGLNAERVYEALLRKGSDGVWRELEDYYRLIAAEKADAA